MVLDVRLMRLINVLTIGQSVKDLRQGLKDSLGKIPKDPTLLIRGATCSLYQTIVFENGFSM